MTLHKTDKTSDKSKSREVSIRGSIKSKKKNALQTEVQSREDSIHNNMISPEIDVLDIDGSNKNSNLSRA
jgi:hypothetical protein